MIVVDASAVLEVLLNTRDGAGIAARLFAAGESLHAPHLLDLEVAQVLRRYARSGELTAQRGMGAQDERSVPGVTPSRGPLTGIRVIELADEQAEYCGLTLAGLGADIVKVEPPGGSPTRRIGPFFEDLENPERSLFFWQYNRGKRSIVLDLRQESDREQFRALVATADVLLESTPRGELDGLGLSADTLMRQVPAL